MDNKDLLEAINQVMPYGKYKGRQLLDLPEPYLVWYHGKGFPQGKLGTQLAQWLTGFRLMTAFTKAF